MEFDKVIEKLLEICSSEKEVLFELKKHDEVTVARIVYRLVDMVNELQAPGDPSYGSD